MNDEQRKNLLVRNKEDHYPYYVYDGGWLDGRSVKADGRLWDSTLDIYKTGYLCDFSCELTPGTYVLTAECDGPDIELNEYVEILNAKNASGAVLFPNSAGAGKPFKFTVTDETAGTWYVVGKRRGARWRAALFEGDTPAAWASYSGEILTADAGGGDAMSSNLLVGVKPTINAKESDGVITSSLLPGNWYNIAEYPLSEKTFANNQTVHLGISAKWHDTAATTGNAWLSVTYADAAGNWNYINFIMEGITTEWKRFSYSAVVPSGMRILDAHFSADHLDAKYDATNPVFSYDSPIALAVAEITAADVKDGKGIKSTAVTYQAAPTQTVTPTGTWSGSVPSLSESNPYLWTRTVITYTDNTTSTSYSVSSAITDPRINSTIIKHEQEYYLSTSDTSLAGGSWSTTFPTRKAGTFYWVRYKDTHANKMVTYDPSANGKLLTEVNEVWNSVVSNQTAINSSNAQINMVATSVTSVKNDLEKKADTESVNSSMDKLSGTVTDIGKQVAELKVKASSIEASVTEVNNLAQTTKKATAALTVDGLSVDTGQTTKSVVDGTGLTITSKADNSVVAKFTTGESEIQNLKIDGFVKIGSHIVQKMQDTEWDGTTVNGTGWMWNGG